MLNIEENFNATLQIKKTIINLLSEGYNMNNVVSTDIVDNEKVSLYSITKKIMDLVLSFIGLILLIPVFLILAILVKLDSKGPVFYAHTRKGKNRNDIKIYKFRTMYSNSDEIFESFSDEQKEEYYKNFKLDKKKYKSNKQKISSYIVQDNDDVKFGEEKGKECAILYTNTLVKKGPDRVRLYEKFMCRKDSSGNWKILGWSNAAKEGKKYFDNSEE